jgi:hypothetical protein
MTWKTSFDYNFFLFLKAAYDLANEAKNRSLGEMSRVSDLIAKIEGFTSGDKATPDDVKTLANEVKK